MIPVIKDNLTGELLDEQTAQSVRFAVEGVSYQMDLSEANAKKFYESIKKYTDVADRVAGSQPVARRTTSSTRTDKQTLQDARAWLRENGHEVSDRGRIKTDLMDLYMAAAK